MAAEPNSGPAVVDTKGGFIELKSSFVVPYHIIFFIVGLSAEKMCPAVAYYHCGLVILFS